MTGMTMRGLAGLVLVLAMTGCQTFGPGKESKKAVRSMQETYEYLGKAAEELQATNAALDRLPSTTDLPAWQKEYNRSVAGLQAAAADARDRWQHMKENSQHYIARWDQEIADAKNPQIQETMQERRQRVATAYDRVTGIAMEVRDAYQPYLEDLVDIQNAVKVDLTPDGVKALGPSIAEAKASGAVVLQKLDALGIELNKLTGRMSPQGAP